MQQTFLQTQFPTLRQIFLEHQVSKAFLFGSMAKNAGNEESDVDFLVKFKDGLDYEAYSDNYFNLLHTLQHLLQKSVDLLAEETLSNPYLIQSINESKIEIL